VLAVFGSLGTATNTATHKYLNERRVPQIFIATGATKWGDPKHFPWTIGWQPTYQTEGHIYAQYLLEHMPNAKVAILYQDDDYGKDYLKGFTDGLGDKAKTMIVKEVSYEVTDPTDESQASGADVFFNVSTPKFAAQAIRKAHPPKDAASNYDQAALRHAPVFRLVSKLRAIQSGRSMIAYAQHRCTAIARPQSAVA
jgi:branched-chain amino acid transport system substrate-binding protein